MSFPRNSFDTIEESRASAELLEAIVRASPAAIFSLDTEGRVRTWNLAAERIFNWSAREIIGQILPIVPPDQQDEHRELKRRVLAGESFSGLEVERIRKDGKRLHLSACYAPLRDANGAVSGTMTIATDLTELNRAERDLHESQARFRDLVESLDDVIFSLDLDGRFRYVSPAAVNYGYTPEEFSGLRFDDFVHPEDLPALRRAFERTAAGLAEPFEFRALDREGKVRTVRVSSRAVLENGRPVGLTGVLIDVTERRQTEAELRQAQKMEAVGRLAGGVAHDFNNMLSVIISHCSMLADERRDDAELCRDLADIDEAAQRAATLTRQLLAFSRKQILQPVVLDLNGVVTEMEKLLRRLIGEDVELVTDISPDLWTVTADPGQIEQVIANLAVNARDAMPDGGRLRIATENADLNEPHPSIHGKLEPGEYVVIAVSDSGCGMDAATQEKIFEPFFTTKEQGKGTGLGLATVFGIVTQSGGGIWVYSEPGRGSVFKVYFPRCEVLASERQPSRGRPDSLPPGRGETILLVEDEEVVRRAVRKGLERQGYRVLAVGSGEHALEVFEDRDGAIDLLVTDVVLPGMTGPKVAETLLARDPDLKILFMSGYTDDILACHLDLMKDRTILQKPVSPRTFGERVRELLDR